MTKKWFYWIFLVLFGCSNDTCDDGNCQIEKCENGTCSYVFYENSSLNIIPTEEGLLTGIEPGEDIVFEYLFVKDDEPEIADDELNVYLRFEIPANQTSFDIQSSDFEEFKVLYQRQCYCVRSDYEYPTDGRITGKKINTNEWHIKANLVVDYYEGIDPYILEFDKKFSKK
jgi:hypothetical protein